MPTLDVAPAPVLKWAGGKTQLLPRILPALPDRIGTYYEPFLGGGAVFFALARARRFRRAVLGDANPELVALYEVLRDQVEDLVDALEAHAPHATDPDYFYALRGLELAGLDPVQRAARLLFLNRTCFNGLYRVNRQGRFNVPFGRYKNPRVLHADQLRASSRALQGVRLVAGDFTATLRAARRGGAAYLDPPYVPRSATSSFTAYAQERFGDEDHRRLLEAFLRLQRRGVPVLLSNSDCRFTRALYRGLKVKAVRAGRSINAVAARRGPVTELLVHGTSR